VASKARPLEAATLSSKYAPKQTYYSVQRKTTPCYEREALFQPRNLSLHLGELSHDFLRSFEDKGKSLVV
jgi:hypothetical protein